MSVALDDRRTPPTALRAVPPPRSGEGWRLFLLRARQTSGRHLPARNDKVGVERQGLSSHVEEDGLVLALHMNVET